jgi:hypothetical protein
MKQEQEEPPLVTVFCFITIILLMILSVVIARNPRDESIQFEYESIQPSVVYAWESPVLHYQVLGSLKGNLIDRIIFCESSGNPKAKNPRSSAYGLCQFIDSTWTYVEKKWDMDLDREDPIDQLYACERLLKEEGPYGHWEESQCCWE